MNDFFTHLLGNRVLGAALTAWVLAQIIKLPLTLIQKREIDWGVLLSPGGMPSSHSALVAGCATALGLSQGFDSPIFALALVLAAVVMYDAIGVRRHAGDHARVLNLMIDELLTGHPLAEKELQEVLGHTPRQVIAGVALGVTTAIIMVGGKTT